MTSGFRCSSTGALSRRSRPLRRGGDSVGRSDQSRPQHTREDFVAPGSMKGMTPSFTERIADSFTSYMTTLSPRSANADGVGGPHVPQPPRGDVGCECRFRFTTNSFLASPRRVCRNPCSRAIKLKVLAGMTESYPQSRLASFADLYRPTGGDKVGSGRSGDLPMRL